VLRPGRKGEVAAAMVLLDHILVTLEDPLHRLPQCPKYANGEAEDGGS
jgi:hypothetical protein